MTDWTPEREQNMRELSRRARVSSHPGMMDLCNCIDEALDELAREREQVASAERSFEAQSSHVYAMEKLVEEQRERIAELEAERQLWPVKIFHHKHLSPYCVEHGCMSEHIRTLREALANAKQNMNDWAAYADEYFKEKHNLAADLAECDAALEATKEIR